MTGLSLEKLQDLIGYSFNNPQLLVEALTHSSFVQEASDGNILVEGNGVQAARVHVVELDLRGHALLFDEHGETDARCLRARVVPRQQLDPRHAKSIIRTR